MEEQYWHMIMYVRNSDIPEAERFFKGTDAQVLERFKKFVTDECGVDFSQEFWSGQTVEHGFKLKGTHTVLAVDKNLYIKEFWFDELEFECAP